MADRLCVGQQILVESIHSNSVAFNLLDHRLGSFAKKRPLGFFIEIKPNSDIDASEDGAMLPIFGKFTNS